MFSARDHPKYFNFRCDILLCWKNSGRFKRYKGTFRPHTTTGLTDGIIQRECDAHPDAHSAAREESPLWSPRCQAWEALTVCSLQLPTHVTPANHRARQQRGGQTTPIWGLGLPAAPGPGSDGRPRPPVPPARQRESLRDCSGHRARRLRSRSRSLPERAAPARAPGPRWPQPGPPRSRCRPRSRAQCRSRSPPARDNGRGPGAAPDRLRPCPAPG